MIPGLVTLVLGSPVVLSFSLLDVGAEVLDAPPDENSMMLKISVNPFAS